MSTRNMFNPDKPAVSRQQTPPGGGFTLIEITIVLVLVAILSIASFSRMNGFIMRAAISEGKNIVGTTASAERIYYTIHGKYFDTGGFVFFSDELGLDYRGHQYFFHEVDVRVFGDTFLVVAHGTDRLAGWSVFYDTDPDNNGVMDLSPEIIVLDPDGVERNL